jgi:hypothetical protein
MFRYFASGEVQSLPADILYLGYDALKDRYTLLNTRLVDSPHLELMELLRRGQDITRCSYVERVATGTLDSRCATKVDQVYLSQIRKRYDQKADAIQTGSYEPIKVISHHDQWFILDGKHTAAVCALSGIMPKCVDASLVMYDSYFWWVYRKMLKRPDSYRKHLDYFESLLC